MLSGVKFIDLFAGIGGFHQALKSYSANCVFASEWDDSASETYKSNYGLEPFGDITLINEKDIPKHDILCGGFPCQAFSISGKQGGFEDTRGTLFFDIARIVKHHLPKVLFLENVRNFEKHDSGRTLKKVSETLNDLGYNFFHKVLNSSDFGLPQNRQRIFMVGFLKSLKIESFDFPKSQNQKVSLSDILENNPLDAKEIIREDTYFTKDYKLSPNLFGEIELPNRPIQIGYVNKGGQGERIYHPLGHAITLSAYGGGAGAKTGLYFVDGKVRKLSPRECARVQGFPEDFKLHQSTNQCYKQFGNSVSVNVLKAITKSIESTGCLKR